jgi:hypothetical protein
MEVELSREQILAALEPLTVEQVHLIEKPFVATFGQFLMSATTWPSETQSTVTVLVVRVIVTENAPPQYYQMRRATWDLFKPVRDGKMRTVRVEKLLRLVVPVVTDIGPTDPDYHRHNDNAMVVEEPALILPPILSLSLSGSGSKPANDNDAPLSFVRPLWLEEQWSDSLLSLLEQGPTVVHQVARYVSDYVTLFFDFVMFQLELRGERDNNNNNKVEQEWLAYIDCRAAAWGHSELAFLFLVMYGQLRRLGPNDLYTKHWLEMQLYLFERVAAPRSIKEFGQKVAHHLKQVSPHTALMTRHSTHAHWHTLSMGNHQEVFWLAHDKGYKVSARWLFEPEFDALLSVLMPRDGFVVLSQEQLTGPFFTALYRHCLLDIVSVTGLLNRPDTVSSLWTVLPSFYGCDASPGVSLLKHLLYQTLSTSLPIFDGAISSEVLLEYNIGEQSYASPVTTEMPRHLELKRMRIAAANKKRAATDAGGTVSLLMDIEELFRQPECVLPPCLSRVVKQKWYKNKDRWNLVAYLIDMGYDNKQDVVKTLCRNRKDVFDHGTIESIYDDRVKKKEKAADTNYMGRCSPRCGTIINATFEAENNLRCLYEERANKEQRRANHTDKEKAKFTRQCAKAMGDEDYRVMSPMDFIGFKAKRIYLSTNTSNNS